MRLNRYVVAHFRKHVSCDVPYEWKAAAVAAEGMFNSKLFSTHAC